MSLFVQPYKEVLSQNTFLYILPVLSLYVAYNHYNGYRAYLALGPGGNKSNLWGYYNITWQSFLALRNPTIPGIVPPEFSNSGMLSSDSVPLRKTSRPVVVGIAPQRQLNQKSPIEVFNSLSQKIIGLAKMYPDQLQMGTSAYEHHSPALFTRSSWYRTRKGEIVHAHAFDGSAHMSLHPADAQIVIEAGWGERHPLARGGFCNRFVPQEFTLIYAPQTADEVDIILEIIKAAWGWVEGWDCNGKPRNLVTKRIASNEI